MLTNPEFVANWSRHNRAGWNEVKRLNEQTELRLATLAEGEELVSGRVFVKDMTFNGKAIERNQVWNRGQFDLVSGTYPGGRW